MKHQLGHTWWLRLNHQFRSRLCHLLFVGEWTNHFLLLTPDFCICIAVFRYTDLLFIYYYYK